MPGGLIAPKLTSPTPTSILVRWEEPKELNGILRSYSLERRLHKSPSDIKAVRTFRPQDNKQYIDTSNSIKPYTIYEYRIKATNDAGTIASQWSSVTTKSSRPGDVRPPKVNVLSPTSVNVFWRQPVILNGQLEMYIVKFPLPRLEISNTSTTTVVVNDLIPFTVYSITVIACTGVN